MEKAEKKDSWKLVLNKKIRNGFEIINNEIPFSQTELERGDKVILLVPVTKSFTFALVETKTRRGFLLHLVDFRYIPNTEKWVSSIKIKIKGKSHELEELRASFLKNRNEDTKTMGQSYFWRKMIYEGFCEIQRPFVPRDLVGKLNVHNRSARAMKPSIA